MGLVGGVGSALTGLTDWQHTHDNARRLGIAHGALNAAALGLYTRSWLDRRRGRPGRARLAGAVGYGLVLASGYLGGDLVFRHRVGVDHADPDRLEPRDFVPVLPETELYDGIPRRVQGAGAAMVLIRHNGSIHAVGEHCPHLGAPLSQGWLYRDQLVCPWHGSRATGCCGGCCTSSRRRPQLRRDLLDTLTSELGVHTQIEDELFYPAVRDVFPLLAAAHAEHRQIDDQLAVVLRTDPAGDDFPVEVAMLAATLEHHAGEEERDMFAQAHALGEVELESLGARLLARQAQLRRSWVTQLRLRVKREPCAASDPAGQALAAVR